ncbi:MAG TPA: zf-HC2 domain-containing protein [Candidatus Acidoferrum sp.]|nr:zf-HC2 domain-containing protein [Candidatus Acidoferrum sp.]
MNCEGVFRRVSSYIDGDLEATVVEEIELHLKQCRDCTILVQQTRLTIHLYYDSDLVDFPVEVQARLHETLRRKIRRERK